MTSTLRPQPRGQRQTSPRQGGGRPPPNLFPIFLFSRKRVLLPSLLRDPPSLTACLTGDPVVRSRADRSHLTSPPLNAGTSPMVIAARPAPLFPLLLLPLLSPFAQHL